MIRPALIGCSLLVAVLAGCGGDADQAGVVATDAPLQQLDYKTVPPETFVTTVPPTNPVVADPAAEAGSESGDATSSGDSSGAGAEEVTTTTEAGQGCTYTVVEGDNPTKIARKTGITVAQFNEANQASGVLENLLIGSKVVIPPPGSC